MLPGSLTTLPMTDIAGIILKVVIEIRHVAQDIEENDRQACRLSKRVTNIEAPMRAVRAGSKVYPRESLCQLLKTMEDIQTFLKGYARTTKFKRALKRRENAAEFWHLGATLTDGMLALQLDVAMDAWAKEDDSDRLKDAESMHLILVDTMERQHDTTERHHAEVMANFKVGVKNAQGSITDTKQKKATCNTFPFILHDISPFSAVRPAC